MCFYFLVSVSIIAYSIAVGLGKIDETLEVEYNSNVFDKIGDLPTHLDEEEKNGYFYTLSMEDRITYCNEAKDFAGIDAVTPITNVPLKYFRQQTRVVLECQTLPISYLYRITLNRTYIAIIMQENEFLFRGVYSYNYEVQITKSEPILYSRSMRSSKFKISVADFINIIRSTNFDNDRFKEILNSHNIAAFLSIIGTIHFEKQYSEGNRLSLLEDDKAMQVCTAAKQRLRKLADGQDNNVYNVPVLQNDRVERAQIFDFGDEIGGHVALHCPSFPSMYVYFTNPTILYTKDLKIVLVQN